MLKAARRIGFLTLFVGLPVLLAACPQKEKPPPPPPPPPPAVDAAPVVLTVEEDAAADAPADADAEAGKKVVLGNTNVLRLKQCCAALGAEAKRMGPSPEAGMFLSAAAQCNAMASQVAPGGNAPEMGALRGLLAGRTVPAVCHGF
ncbi:MAG: hypothetical protein QM702_20880 [Rubrivivax sp.]